MRVSSESDIDYWASLEGTLSSMLSNLGRLAVNQGTGTVTVTDVRDVIDRITRHIEEENRTMTRQIGFEVQLYSVRSDDGSEFGVDWNLVYQKLNEFQFGYRSPSSLVSDVVGDGSIKIIKSNNNFNGTEAFLKAAASGNKVSLVTSQRAVTLNRQVVPVAVTSQRSYIAENKVTVTPGPPAITEITRTLGTVTTGFILNLMPSVTERNAMVLTVGLDLSELKELRSFGNIDTNGVQAPEVASTQFVQRVALRTGETLVLTGFEQVKSNSKERTLDNNVSPGLGGSFVGNTTKDSLVFLITPVMVEGL
jgi:type IVB pilus formation R64 PilN family outer membrane protein